MRLSPLSFLLCGALAAPLFCVPAQAATFPQKAVRVYLMEWRWEDVAKECSDYLGPNGFKGVQVSAPNEHANVSNFNGFVHPWFERYGAVSYKVGNRSGTRAQFKSMIDTCHAAGVEVYADTVLNHMASTVPDGQTHMGIQGSAYTAYSHPDAGYVFGDFHHYQDGCNALDNNFNWDDKNIIGSRGCRLNGLSDLKTETPKVQAILANYLKDLMLLGVDGFRLDSAKHINDRDLKSILTQAGGAPKFVYSEVLSYIDQPINGGQYLDIGDVTVAGIGEHVSSKFSTNQAWKLREWENSPIGEAWQFEPSNKAVVYIDTHDSQRDSATILSYKQPELYKLANVFLMAYPYGKPLMMSSFYFENRNWGAPYNADGSIKSVFAADGSLRCGAKEWICEHRWPLFRRLVAFRNYVDDAKELKNWWSNRAGQIAFSRGNKAFTAINTEINPLTQTLQTGLIEGDYCDIFSSEFDYSAKTCKSEDGKQEGKWIHVFANGTANIQLGARSAVVIHSDARKNSIIPSTIVRMVGNFNAWQVAGNSVLTPIGNAIYQAELTLPAGQLEYKFSINGVWAGAYGDDSESANLPQIGTAKNTSSIGNISLKLTRAGLYRITFNSSNGAYQLSWQGGNVAPIANAGADQTVALNQTVTLSSLSSDADGDVLTCVWRLPNAETLAGCNNSTRFSSIGSKGISLTVSDGQGHSATDDLVVTVQNNPPPLQRTLIFIFGQTNNGQDMFIRGGIDHNYAASIGRICTPANMLCAIPIQHLNTKNTTTNPWKTGDSYLDWYGLEAAQASSAQGTPLDWSTNNAANPFKIAVNGYGYTPLNTWGDHYWMLDVLMDCSKTVNNWFEVKSFISNGPGWEADVNQANRPWVSGNHFAQCGKLNMFKRGDSSAIIQAIP